MIDLKEQLLKRQLYIELNYNFFDSTNNREYSMLYVNESSFFLLLNNIYKASNINNEIKLMK